MPPDPLTSSRLRRSKLASSFSEVWLQPALGLLSSLDLCFFFISRFSYFSVIYVDEDIKIKSRERIDFDVVFIFFSVKVRVAM